MQTAFEAHPDPLSLYSVPGKSALGPSHMDSAGYGLVAELVAERADR